MAKMLKCVAFSIRLALTVAVSGASAAAAERASLDLGLKAKPGFSRLTFAWQRIVDYRVEQTGNVVTISFRADRAIAGHEAASRHSRLIRWAASRRIDGLSELALVLVPRARVRHFRHGPAIIVDVLAPPTAAPVGHATVSPSRPSRAPASGHLAAR